MSPELKQNISNHFKTGCILGVVYCLVAPLRHSFSGPWWETAAIALVSMLWVAPAFGLIAVLAGLALHWESLRVARKARKEQTLPQ